MSEALLLPLAWIGGALLGAVFFGGLFWTIGKGVSSHHPAVWFLLSLLIRTSVTVAGFYFVSGGQWQRLLLCLLGFIMARVLVIRLTTARGVPEVTNASQF